MTPLRGNVGQANGNAKLNDEIVREIRRRLANGERNRDVCYDYDVTRSAIASIKSRRTWGHVDA